MSNEAIIRSALLHVPLVYISQRSRECLLTSFCHISHLIFWILIHVPDSKYLAGAKAAILKKTVKSLLCLKGPTFSMVKIQPRLYYCISPRVFLISSRLFNLDLLCYQINFYSSWEDCISPRVFLISSRLFNFRFTDNKHPENHSYHIIMCESSICSCFLIQSFPCANQMFLLWHFSLFHLFKKWIDCTTSIQLIILNSPNHEYPDSVCAWESNLWKIQQCWKFSNHASFFAFLPTQACNKYIFTAK